MMNTIIQGTSEATRAHSRPHGRVFPLTWAISAVCLLLIMVGTVPVTAQEATEAPAARPETVNLLDATTAGAWRGPVTVVRGKGGETGIEIRPRGGILDAALEFAGIRADWSGYRYLLLDIQSTVPGILNVAIREPDGDELEPWIAVERVSGERETLSIGLAAKPEGDLVLGGPQHDRKWNPDSASRLTLTLTTGGGALRVFGITLARDLPEPAPGEEPAEPGPAGP